MTELDKYNQKNFEDIKFIDESGNEYWEGRELMTILQYSNWQNFEKIIKKAIIGCENSGLNVTDHFIDVSKMVPIGSGAYRKEKDYRLSILFLLILVFESGLQSKFEQGQYN